MAENYNNPMGRLNEARKHYKSLLNEAGYPGTCCNGTTCVPVSFVSASSDCATYDNPNDQLTYSECDQNCGNAVSPIELDLDKELLDDGNPTGPKKDCTKCQNGYAVMMQVTSPAPCSSLGQGWVDAAQGVDPCDDPNNNSTCDFPTLSVPCASQADLTNKFVSGNPSQFLSNMATWYANPPGSGTGCDFLEVVRQKHIGHLSTGIAINGNHPNGIQMGPLWIGQKTSKVAYLDCILQALDQDGCCGGPGNPNGPGNPQQMVKPKPDDSKQVKRGGMGSAKGVQRKGMRK